MKTSVSVHLRSWLLLFYCIIFLGSFSQQKINTDSMLLDFKVKTSVAFAKYAALAGNSDEKRRFYFHYNNLISLRKQLPNETFYSYFKSKGEVIIFERVIPGVCEDYTIRFFTLKKGSYRSEGYDKICAEAFKKNMERRIAKKKMEELLKSAEARSRKKSNDCFYILTRVRNGEIDTELLFQCENLYGE